MQKIVALCSFFAILAVVCSVDPEEPIAILKSESNVNDDGSYNFMYEAGNGNFREESGAVVNPGTDDQTVKVTGSYKYIDANGQEVSVQYTADEFGFVPVGNIIAKEISDVATNARNLPHDDAEVPKKH